VHPFIERHYERVRHHRALGLDVAADFCNVVANLWPLVPEMFAPSVRRTGTRPRSDGDASVHGEAIEGALGALADLEGGKAQFFCRLRGAVAVAVAGFGRE
jgi:hypothetical protein